jgi:hypothetical protein
MALQERVARDMDKKIEGLGAATETVQETGNGKAVYRKPSIECLGRLVDFTGGLSQPALESGDPQNRHDDFG